MSILYLKNFRLRETYGLTLSTVHMVPAKDIPNAQELRFPNKNLINVNKRQTSVFSVVYQIYWRNKLKF